MRLTPKQVRAALPKPVGESRSAHVADLSRELARREMAPQNKQNQARIADLRKILSG